MLSASRPAFPFAYTFPATQYAPAPFAEIEAMRLDLGLPPLLNPVSANGTSALRLRPANEWALDVPFRPFAELVSGGVIPPDTPNQCILCLDECAGYAKPCQCTGIVCYSCMLDNVNNDERNQHRVNYNTCPLCRRPSYWRKFYEAPFVPSGYQSEQKLIRAFHHARELGRRIPQDSLAYEVLTHVSELMSESVSANYDEDDLGHWWFIGDDSGNPLNLYFEEMQGTLIHRLEMEGPNSIPFYVYTRLPNGGYTRIPIMNYRSVRLDDIREEYIVNSYSYFTPEFIMQHLKPEFRELFNREHTPISLGDLRDAEANDLLLAMSVDLEDILEDVDTSEIDPNCLHCEVSVEIGYRHPSMGRRVYLMGLGIDSDNALLRV